MTAIFARTFCIHYEKSSYYYINDSYTIVLNIDCPKEKSPKELETFFAYVEKGEKSGFSKGEKSGAAQEKREIAKNLKSLKLPVEQIRTATGLSLAEIEAL